MRVFVGVHAARPRPIGLDLGARTPEETAISVAAEIVARRWGGSGVPLTGTGGPIDEAFGPPPVPAAPAAAVLVGQP